MRVIAKRLFISTIYGNVGPGECLDVSDAHGKHLIDNGLAEEIKSAGPIDAQTAPEGKPSVFMNPVAKDPEHGSLSQAAPVLPTKIAKQSGSGVKTKGRKKDASR